LVGTTKVYPGLGADIVMESISLIEDRQAPVNERYGDVTSADSENQ